MKAAMNSPRGPGRRVPASRGHETRHARVVWALALLTVVCPATRLFGQDTLRLTLPEVLTQVQTEHPFNQQALASTTAAVARAAGLSRITNPSVSFERVIVEYQALLVQILPWPWEQVALRRLGTANVQVAKAEASLGLQSVALEAALRFADALKNKVAVVHATEAESLATLGLNHTMAARQMGQGGDLAVLQARVSLDAARRARLAAAHTSQASIAAIAILLGHPPETPLVLNGELATLAPIMDPDSIIGTRAILADPEANRLTAIAVQAEREAGLARARILPQIQVGPTFGYNSLIRRGRWSWFVQVDVPIFHNQGDAIRAAQGDQAAAIAARSGRERELAELVFDAAATRSRAQQELTALRGGDLLRAAQAESLAVRALQQGGPYMTTWLATHEAYLSTRRAELDLEWQAARARLMLRHLTGTLVEATAQAPGNGS